MKGLGIAVAAVVVMIGTVAVAADTAPSPQANAAFLADYAKKPGVVVELSGLQHRVIHSGFGKRPSGTDLVTVNYKGTLINGTVFDATEPGLPAQFTANKLIPGWTEALKLMREGDEWELVIPASLAYGARGAGGLIGPNQTLVFDLTLISVSPPPPDQDKNGQSQ